MARALQWSRDPLGGGRALGGAQMEVKAFYDPRTNTLTYVVWDPATRDGVVIDPVLDYEPQASKTWTESVDVVLEFLAANDVRLHYILETHAHADHLSGSQAIKARYPEAQLAVGERITVVQEVFKGVFDLPADFPTDGRQFDRLLREGEVVEAGSLRFEVMFTPGHTPACATYRFGDALFTGDALFMPDSGTGRCDFPAGSAEDLYDSIQRLYAFPEETRIFVGHDYQPGGRALRYKTTVGEQKADNVQLPASRSRSEFVRFRTERDATLAAPKLLFQSVQVNVDAGALPKPSENQVRYLRIPINVFRPEPGGTLVREAPGEPRR
jgi:glyoxylase-like metal-dependent hydrolase (beta-lactamase superfamily II)